LAKIDTTFAVSSTGRPRSSARSAKAKPIVAAPIAKARVSTISALVPGARAKPRSAVFTSLDSSNHIRLLLGYDSRACGDSLIA
jgi:hypothetical protein